MWNWQVTSSCTIDQWKVLLLKRPCYWMISGKTPPSYFHKYTCSDLVWIFRASSVGVGFFVSSEVAAWEWQAFDSSKFKDRQTPWPNLMMQNWNQLLKLSRKLNIGPYLKIFVANPESSLSCWNGVLIWQILTPGLYKSLYKSSKITNSRIFCIDQWQRRKEEILGYL